MSTLGSYERVKSLGRGSCGTVDLMVRTADTFPVALKHIDLDMMSDKEKDNTMKEVEVMSRIVHPNVVGYFESFVEDGSLHIAMEYADGGSLQRQWKKAQEAQIHFSEKQVLHWCAQIINALKYVHGMKIMHRDLKLANIMLTKQNIVKIADFGLARVLGSQTQFANTCCGTPYYLSPEVCLEKPYDQKSDSWALGCILYELCALKRPFDAKNLPSIVMKICHGDPKPVSSAYSLNLRSLIACLLEKKPHDRPSMDEITRMPFMQEALEAVEQLIASARPPKLPKQLTQMKASGNNSAASSPIPDALKAKFAAVGSSETKISNRFAQMRSKLGDKETSEPAAPDLNSSAIGLESANASTASMGGGSSEEMSSTAEEWSARMADSAGLDLNDDVVDAAAGEGPDPQDQSVLADVMGFTKNLLSFTSDSDSVAKRIYDCSKKLNDAELSEEACVLEKLWEDALGQASEENQDAVESQRIGAEAKALADQLRSKDLGDAADEVEAIFSDESLVKNNKDGCAIC